MENSSQIKSAETYLDNLLKDVEGTEKMIYAFQYYGALEIVKNLGYKVDVTDKKHKIYR